ncbi:hypothetical protein AOLI_G00179270 [Acnodon oligacanthus]
MRFARVATRGSQQRSSVPGSRLRLAFLSVWWLVDFPALELPEGPPAFVGFTLNLQRVATRVQRLCAYTPFSSRVECRRKAVHRA